MTLESRRYRRQQHARYDKAQRILDAKGSSPNPALFAVKSVSLLDPLKKVTCPFCLGLEELRLFLISTKKGLSRSLGKCPMCGNGMKLKTLIASRTWTARTYAEFVVPYASEGFWQKCKWSIWKDRLKLMGWTQEFWDRYHELRPKDESENYSEYMNRQGREFADRLNREEPMC